ncbi:ABC transporter ATP-binding protein [Paenibacillus ottowii]
MNFIWKGCQHELASLWKTVRHGLQLFRLIFRMNKKYMIPSMILHIIQGAVPVMTLMVTQNLLNSVSVGWKEGEYRVLSCFVWFIVIYVLKNFIDVAQSYVEGNLQAAISNSMNVMICEKSTTLGLADFENASINDQLKRVSQESTYRPYQLYSQMAGITSGIITLISSAILLVLWKWWVVLVIFIISTFSIYSIFKINREQFQIYLDRTPKYRESWYMTYLLTNDSTFKEVKIFQLGSYLLNRYRDLLHGFFLVDRRILLKRIRVTFLYDMLEMVALFWLIGLAIHETFIGAMMIGSLYGYIQAIMLTQNQMNGVIQGLVQFSQNNLYMEQLLLFLQLPTSDPVNRQKQLPSATELSCHANASVQITQISFNQVSFAYPGQDSDTIREVDVTFKKGQTVAIVGKNGSGKSTLMKLLMQLYKDYRGTIQVNGRNVLDYDLQKVQERMGVVFQDFVHYEMSARHNIGFGSLAELEQDERLIDAAKVAAIDQVIANLPNGLDTQLGKWFDEGHQLSGGQWQRIAIARAILRSADVYILDEPSSFLDPLAERDLLQLFMHLMRDTIGIFITHRISSARLADQILVMENGRIIEQGSHAELIRLGGVYAQMYQVQASSFAEEVAVN